MGSSKHKLIPRRFGLEPYTGEPETPTYCDADAGFEPTDIVRVPAWLHSGIVAGPVGANDLDEDPSIVWVVSDQGWIFEGRITVPGQAIYHGYPVLRNEAIAVAVLERFDSWTRGSNVPEGIATLTACRERYLR